MNYSTTFNFLHPNRYCWYLFKSLICCLCIFLISPQLSAQVTPPGATNDAGCGEDCFGFFVFAPLEDGAGNEIPNLGEGVAEDNNCNTIIDATIEYSGADTSPDLTGASFGANNQGTSTDNWTVTFGTELTNPIIAFGALKTQTPILITDCDGNTITATCVTSCSNSLTFTPGVGWTGDNSYTLQLSGTFDCIQISADIDSGDSYTINVGTCLSAAPILPCVDCGPDERLRYLTLTNQTGSGTGATADVNLDGVLYGTAEVVFSDLSINEDLSGSAFGAFAQDDESFILRVDLCEAITVQQIDILGLETESQVWVGNTLNGMGASAVPAGFALEQCGGRPTMAPTGNMVTNISSSCANQGNGNYTVTGGLTTNTLFFRYTNPAGGCSFDKATFRIGACVSDAAEVVPACPLTLVTITDDPDGYAADIQAGGNGNSFTTSVTRDADGNYFDQTCNQLRNTPTPVATISPCAEIVDEILCGFCTPVPPCVTCGPDANYEYLTLANAAGSGTGATADVLLDGVLYGDAEVLFSNLSINEDLSGSAFGAFASGAEMEETFVLRVNLCDPISIRQVDILGLETESQVWVGTRISGTGMNATPTDLTLTQCDGSETLTESGNMVTNNASGCGNQSDGNYTVTGAPISTLYFRYTNPAGGCSFDKATFRIGTCVPVLADVIPACPLTLVTITDDPDGYAADIQAGGNGNNFTTFVTRDADGNYFDQTCNELLNEVGNQIPTPVTVISPCSEVVDENSCGFCEPTPPCVACEANTNYEYLTLANAMESGTGATADVLLDGVLYGDAEVLFSNLSINEDLSGSAFGAFADSEEMTETFVLQVNLCAPIAIQQVDILGLETQSRVWVGTDISGSGMNATPTGLTLTQCDGSETLSESGNMVTNNASRCSDQSDGNYTVDGATTTTLYFRYTNLGGGCNFDKATFRIGACVPELTEAIPACPLVSLEITEQDGVTTSSVFRDDNGLFFNAGVCTNPIDTMTLVQSIAISPCATIAVTGECEFCCEFVVTCPANTDLGTFDCNTLGNIPATPSVMISPTGNITVDNAAGDYQINVGNMPCGTIVANTSDDITVPDICSTGGQVITRTVTIFDDENGNGVYDMASEDPPVSCNFTINITEDTTPPVITCPADVTIECTDDTSTAANGMATATDNCSSMADINITFTDNSSQTNTGCGQFEYTIMRTWMASDACGNTSTCVQVIAVEDTTSPVITCPADVTIECSDDTSPAANGMATATDNCSGMADINITFTDNSSQTNTGCGQFEYTIIRNWVATDACGNTASCFQTIEVEDTTPAVITCPANVTIECTVDTSPATNGMATAVDNCASTEEVTITFSDVSTQTTSGCGQFDFVITRTWMSSDPCGNTSTCVQMITVEDTTSPVITCPADITLPCNTDPLPIATSISEFIAIGGTVTDNCSNLDELTLTLTNSPASPSMLNFCPGTPEADRTLTRTYTITDICGNVSTCAQRFIYLESTTGPVITAIPLDQTIDCSVNAIPQLSLFAAESDCININYTVTGLPVTGTLDCPGSDIQFLYTATDDCGRTATHIQTYTLVNDLPEFVCPTSICVIESPADTDVLQEQFDDYASLATVITSCAGNGYSVSNNFNPNGFIPQSCTNPTVAVNNAVAYQVVTFSATDNCGRNTSCTAVVVLQDNNGPVLSGTLSFGQADCNDSNLQADYTDWANTQLNGLSATDDNQGSVAISYTPLSPNVDCSNGIATTQVTFTATDDCGNVSSQTTVYQIFDNAAPTTATVFGTIATEADETMALVEVSADGGASNQMTTTSDGYYHFDLEMANNYTITPDRTDDPMNGITTYDLILLGQHLLEINTLDSPYKIIAADVNESGHISSLDMIELRRLILQITDEFSSGKSWTFVDAGYNFPQPTNPFATTFPTAYNINHLDNNEHINFVGVKLGDLNGSANPSLLQAGDTRSSDGTLNINLEDQFIKAGQTYQLEFKADKFEEILGFQFTIDFANDYLAFADYQTSKLEGMNSDNLGFTKVDEGKITVSWNENQAVSLADESTLFQLSFTALQDGQLSELLSFNSSLIAQEAYQGNLRKKVELGFQNTALSDQKFALFQNRPNPFVEKTVIGFQLPEATEATLTIFDIAGRVVWTQTTEYAKGLQQVTIDEQKLGEEGIYFYQLSTRRTTATKKLILVD